jgi:2'-hydroxyisoflavone reductase
LHFDATVDTIAYRPQDVRNLANALDGRGGHHIQISSISAYHEPALSGATEDDVELYADGLVDENSPITGETYGPLKAACEFEAARQFGGALSIIRPTYVIGAHDKTLRFPYWVARVARGGTIAVPAPSSVSLQWIDARDLAQFTVSVAARQLAGAWHTTSAPRAFGDVIGDIVRTINPDARVVEVDPSTAPENAFPLWSGPEGSPILEMDSSRAVADGLSIRSLEESIRDTASWIDAHGWSDGWLDPAIEAQLIRQA